jgi:Uma2 family endonuclease
VHRVRGHVRETPDLIVEVISPDSRRYDSETKRRDYEAAGVGEYWLIDPQRRTFQFFVLRDGALVEAKATGTEYAATVLPGFVLDLERLRQLF